MLVAVALYFIVGAVLAVFFLAASSERYREQFEWLISEIDYDEDQT